MADGNKKSRHTGSARKKNKRAVPSAKRPSRLPSPGEPGSAEKNFLVVGIGASAGGIAALRELLKEIPAGARVAFVIVSHLDPKQKSHLPEVLARATALRVVEATDGAPVQPGVVFVIPPDRDLTVKNGRLEVTPRNEGRRLYLPVDCFFLSLARELGERAVAIVLSGTGGDGARGVGEIKTRGGVVFAQTDTSAGQSGMPRAAIATGAVDFVLPPGEIGRELVLLSRIAHDVTGSLREPGPDPDLRSELFALLRGATDVDFSHYKPSTIWRRIHRRMSLKGRPSLREYVPFLRANPEEVTALYQDILINVTCFFRDSEVFDVLRRVVFAKLPRRRAPDDPFRIWVPGCSTGEEVYSIAMTLLEHLGEPQVAAPLQIFGTDINDSVVERARHGLYSKRVLDGVSDDRLQRFFVKTSHGYQISKSVRDLCVFARQNVIADPPLSKMDLITCRNLLIYLSPALQKKVIPRFHYALKPGGHLLLGKSEVIDVFSDLFTVVDKRAKLYVKKGTATRPLIDMPAARPVGRPGVHRKDHPPEALLSDVDLHDEVDRLILGRFTPPSILLNRELDIIQFRGAINPYLDLGSRRAALNLTKVMQHSFVKQVRSAIDALTKGKTVPSGIEGVRLRHGHEFRRVNARIAPLRKAKEYFLLWFEETRTAGPPKEAGVEGHESTDETKRLEEELAATREYLQSIVDERELRNEELQSANEEVLSSNEELQTMNQELETSKEELESANEELATLNEELQHRLEQLKQTEERFRLLVSQVKEYAIFVLDPEGHVLSWNEGAQRINGYEADEIIGRHFSAFYPTEDARSGKPQRELKIAAQTGIYQEEGIRIRKEGSAFWASVVITALHDENHKLYGFAKVTRDITDHKRAEDELRRLNDALERRVMERTRALEEANSSLRAEMVQRREIEEILRAREAQLRIITDANPSLVSYIDSSERYLFTNEAHRKWFGLSPEELRGKMVSEVIGPKAHLNVRGHFKKALRGEAVTFETRAEGESGRSRFVLGTCIPDRDDQGEVRGIVAIIEDITERKRYEEELRRQAVDLVRINRELTASNEELSQFAHVSSHDLKEPLRMVKSYTQLLKLKLGDKLEGDEIKCMGFITEGATRMDRLINDLLAYSAVGRANGPMSAVDLNQVVELVRQTLADSLSVPGTELSVETLPTICGNETEMVQVFQNLVANALKFRGEAPARVRVWAETRDGEWVVGVRDNGIGISPQYQDRIFVIFQRLHSRKEYPGTGIGLAICKKIIERHGGRIWVESEHGHGSTFYFTVPAVPREGA